MATKGDPERAVAYERAWHHSLELRRIHRQLTAGIGVALVAYAVIRVLIVSSFSTGTAVLAQEVPGILLIALVVLIRLRVPRLRRIVDAEQAALAAEPITTNTNAGTARGEGSGQQGAMPASSGVQGSPGLLPSRCETSTMAANSSVAQVARTTNGWACWSAGK